MTEQVIFGDCLDEMKLIGDKSVNLILIDPPFGITAPQWDKRVDFIGMWAEYKRILSKNGTIAIFSAYSETVCKSKHQIPRPDIKDVLYSLILDSNVLNYPEFEEWASDCGYETDSRKAESIYRDCLKNALKMRGSLGESLLAQLSEAFQDY